MTQVATKLHPKPPALIAGVVVATSSSRWRVDTDEGIFEAERAVSCLVEPEERDYVLLSTTPAGAFVLAVLARDGDDATLKVQGNLRIQPETGDVVIASQGAVRIASGEDVSIVSKRFTMNAIEGVIGLQRLNYVGRAIESEVEKIRLFAGTVDTWMDRLTQKAKRVYRRVEELDQLKAKRIDYRTEDTMRLHGKHTLMTADELFKIDGEQIHMG